MQPLSATFFTKIVYTVAYVVYNYAKQRRWIMGIHYDYKSTRGAKKLQKQHEKEQRRLRKKSQQMPKEKTGENRPLTLDMITDPDK